MRMEITIVETFCGFGHNFFKKQPFCPFFIRILAISYKKIWQPWLRVREDGRLAVCVLI